jgi:N-acetylmuramoyl-L-alanine amidase
MKGKNNMFKIALQGGHLYRKSGSIGAPGEQELTDRIRKRLAEILIARKFQVFLFNADPPYENLNQDFDLFLSLHGDADIYGTGGGFADFPEPSTDGATAESQRIAKVINDTYFPETQIKYVNRSNKNTRYYYMWKQISAKTPCVIIEMGVVQNAHDKVLLGNTELIAGALGRAICKAFGVSYEAQPITPPPVDNSASVIEGLKKRVAALEKELSIKESDFTRLLAEMQTNCNLKITAYKNKIIQFIQEMEG